MKGFKEYLGKQAEEEKEGKRKLAELIEVCKKFTFRLDPMDYGDNPPNDLIEGCPPYFPVWGRQGLYFACYVSIHPLPIITLRWERSSTSRIPGDYRYRYTGYTMRI